MRFLLPATLLLFCQSFWAQQWIDLVYEIGTTTDIPYGLATDFAGNTRELKFDISVPTDDSPPECGRPLFVIIHGGAFLAGDKGDQSPARIREDFAKRGYASVSIQYRLGQFQTNLEVHCNASGPNLEWDCLNMTDTSEWYRAFYRGVQDVHGALRYLGNHADTYNINPDNVFVAGESAGGFIALGVGFIDDDAEVLNGLTGQYPDAPLPNQIYEAPCIQNPPYTLDTSLATLNLVRPDLGSYSGTLNFPAERSIQIKGVGNLFGAVFNNIFSTTQGIPPALYLYHQPADLIVPFNSNKVLQGYTLCATGFPFNCQNIINRPIVHGSNSIRTMLEDLETNGETVPDYFIDFTSNHASCAEQILNPSLGGHALDNYSLRMGHLASFFAGKVDSCTSTAAKWVESPSRFKVFPNPASFQNRLTVVGRLAAGDQIVVLGMDGTMLSHKTLDTNTYSVAIPQSVSTASGVFIIQIVTREQIEIHRVVRY